LSGLQALAYRSDHLCVAVPSGHPFAARKRLRYEQTLEEITIGVAPGGTMETMLRRQAALAGKSLVHRMEVSSLDAACRIVAAGLGIAILPREAATPHVRSGLTLVPLFRPVGRAALRRVLARGSAAAGDGTAADRSFA
jgi:DNA-binding transcriptional LysR family regulator